MPGRGGSRRGRPFALLPVRLARDDVAQDGMRPLRTRHIGRRQFARQRVTKNRHERRRTTEFGWRRAGRGAARSVSLCGTCGAGSGAGAGAGAGAGLGAGFGAGAGVGEGAGAGAGSGVVSAVGVSASGAGAAGVSVVST